MTHEEKVMACANEIADQFTQGFVNDRMVENFEDVIRKYMSIDFEQDLNDSKDKTGYADAYEYSLRIIADSQKTLASNLTLDHRLKETELRSDARFERIDGELKLNRWMLGIIIAGIMSLVLKAFFA